MEIQQGLVICWFLLCFAECCREATLLFTELDSHVCDQLIHSCVGSDSRVWVRWMGQRDQLCETNWHIWAVCKVLSMQASKTSSSTSPTSLKVDHPLKLEDDFLLSNPLVDLVLLLLLILYHTWGNSNILPPTCDVCWIFLFLFFC